MRLIFLCLCLLLASVEAAHLTPLQTHQAIMGTFQSVHKEFLSLTETVINHAHADFSFTHEKFLAVHDAAVDFHTEAVNTLAQPSVACVSALNQLNTTLYSSACVSIVGLFGTNPLSNPTPLVSQIGTICNSTCLQTLAILSANVSAQCQSSDAAALSASVTEVISYSNLLCTKDPVNPSNYCIAEFFNALAPIQANTQAVTNAQLQAFCIPCTYAIVNGFLSYGGLAVDAAVNLTAVSLFCAVDGVTGQFCLPEMLTAAGTLEVLAKLTSPTIPTITDAVFQPVCTSCTKKFLSLGNPAIGADLAQLCATNGNDYCFVKAVDNFQPVINALLNSATPTGYCPAISTYISTVGCCLGPFITLMNAFPFGTALDFGGKISGCTLTVPGNCTIPTYTGTFNFVILNIAASYYAANNASVNAAIIADVTTTLGVTASQVSITGVVSTTGGIQVTLQILFTSTLESATCIAIFNSNIKASNFPLTNTAFLGPNSRTTPLMPVSVSTSNYAATSNAPAYTTAAPSTSPAAQQSSASVMLLAMPIVALLFAKN